MRLLEQVRVVMRRRHHAPGTVRQYVFWIKTFIFFHDLKHPLEVGPQGVVAFLNHLAVERGVAVAWCCVLGSFRGQRPGVQRAAKFFWGWVSGASVQALPSVRRR